MGNAESQKRHHSESSGRDKQSISQQHDHASADDMPFDSQGRRMSVGDTAHPPRSVVEEVESISSNAKHQNKTGSTQDSDSSVDMASTAVEFNSDTKFGASHSSNELSLEKQAGQAAESATSFEDFNETNSLRHAAVEEKLKDLIESVISMAELGQIPGAASDDCLFNTPSKCDLNKTDIPVNATFIGEPCTNESSVSVNTGSQNRELIINAFAEKLLKDTFKQMISDCYSDTVESQTFHQSSNDRQRVPVIMISCSDNFDNPDTCENNAKGDSSSEAGVITTEATAEQESSNCANSEVMSEFNGNKSAVESVAVLIEDLVDSAISDGLCSIAGKAPDKRRVMFDCQLQSSADSNVDALDQKNHPNDCSSEASKRIQGNGEKEILKVDQNNPADAKVSVVSESSLNFEYVDSDRNSTLVRLADNITTDVILSSLKLIESEDTLHTVKNVLEILLNTVINSTVPHSSPTKTACLDKHSDFEKNTDLQEDLKALTTESHESNSATCILPESKTEHRNSQEFGERDDNGARGSTDTATSIGYVEESLLKTPCPAVVTHQAETTDVEDNEADLTESGLDSERPSNVEGAQVPGAVDLPPDVPLIDQRNEDRSVVQQTDENTSNCLDVMSHTSQDNSCTEEGNAEHTKSMPAELISTDAIPGDQLSSDSNVDGDEVECSSRKDDKQSSMLNENLVVETRNDVTSPLPTDTCPTVDHNSIGSYTDEDGTSDGLKIAHGNLLTEQHEDYSLAEMKNEDNSLEAKNIIRLSTVEDERDQVEDKKEEAENESLVQSSSEEDNALNDQSKILDTDALPAIAQTNVDCTDGVINAVEPVSELSESCSLASVNQGKMLNESKDVSTVFSLESKDINEVTPAATTEHSHESPQANLEECDKDSSSPVPGISAKETADHPTTTESVCESFQPDFTEEHSSTVSHSDQTTPPTTVLPPTVEKDSNDYETELSEDGKSFSDAEVDQESAMDRQQRLADKGARLMKRKQQEAAGGMKLKSSSAKTSSTGSAAAPVYNHSASSSLSASDHISSISPDNLSSTAELKSALGQLEEKYKQAMVQAAQLDNERSQLQYQTLQLKDLLEEQEDDFYRLKSEHKTSLQEIERQKRTISLLQKKCSDLQESLHQRDELIQERGLVVVGEGSREEVDGFQDHDDSHPSSKIALVTPEAAEVLQSAGDGPLDSRLKNLAEEKQSLIDQIRQLKFELDEERRKIVVNGNDSSLHSEYRLPEMQLLEVQREANKVVSEYKLKLQKSEQDIAACHGNISRLEGQLSRLKQTSETYEKNEDEMRAEKRKLMRDLRTALDRIEEMEMTNSHLEKRLERVRASRTAINQT